LMPARTIKHHATKSKLRWTLPSGWRKSESAKGVLSSWETANGENMVVVRKEGKLFVVEASDHMGEYTHRTGYLDARSAFDGAYDEMWGRSPDWH
jgi:hypothetical protein